MAWEVFQRDDVIEGRDTPFVSITSNQFFFNAAFARAARRDSDRNLTVHVDLGNRKLGFEFHADSRPNSFVLTAGHKSGKAAGRYAGFTSACAGLVRNLPWLRSITRLPQKQRRFTPTKERNIWVIQLCPAFEEQRARESGGIPAGVTGIYRYVRESGEIVYIGRGDIRKRLASPERAEWDFDRVEYSVVADPDQQVKWETYWIDRFKDDNAGRLPFYNRVSGAALPEEESA